MRVFFVMINISVILMDFDIQKIHVFIYETINCKFNVFIKYYYDFIKIIIPLIHYRRQTSLKPKTSWIKALYNHAHKICSNKKSLNKQISQIKAFMSWNSYPKRVQNSVIKRLQTNRSRPRLTDDDYRRKIW